MAFSWSKVPRKHRLNLLRHALPYTNSASRVGELGKLTDDELASWCDQIFRTPPRPVWFQSERLGPLLLEQWLPGAPDLKVERLYTEIANHRREPTGRRTKRSQVAYLQGLRSSVYLRNRIRHTFLSCYQEPGRPKTATRPKLLPKRELEGRAAKPRRGWPHQEDAWKALDRCRLDGPEPARGLIVFPTGAGKTFTVTKWLTTRWLGAREDSRVLWLAHREELLWQAYTSFAASVAEESPDLVIPTSLVCSDADNYKRLGDPKLRLGIVSIGNIGRDFTADKRNVIKEFTSRPTVLVIDEAHHGGAATYQALIKHAFDTGDIRMLLGLTATPRPTGADSRRKFFELFPKVPLAEAPVDQLTAEGILARPEIHVVDTLESISLAEDEITKTEALGDLPIEVLDKKLVTDHRDQVIVQEYRAAQDVFGKALVFAINRRHADRLGKRFEKIASTVVLHGASDVDRGDVLRWFEGDAQPKVLVSVGMLTEGVDLPSAETVILARPTASYILLRQMIGRALRGERARGKPVAHIVYLRDQWTNFSDVLDPAEVIDEPTIRETGVLEQRLPEIRDSSTGAPLPAAVIAAAERIYRNLEHQMHVARNGLSGYYILGHRRIPVFTHQIQGFQELISAAQEDLRGRALLSFFEHTPDPVPSFLSLSQLVAFVREEGPPDYISFEDETTPTAVARELLDSEQTERSRKEFIRSRWETSAVRLVYPELGQFEEVVSEEIERLLVPTGGHRGIDDDIQLSESSEPKPRLRLIERDYLPQLQDQVIEWIRQQLPHISARAEPPPPIEWTCKVVGSWYAHWTIKLVGRDRGQTRLSVNRLLSTQKRIVSDDMLRYLIYHEMLHHLLPLHGHDRLFRLLESKWPDAVELDARFEALSDNWELDPMHYRRSVASRSARAG